MSDDYFYFKKFKVRNSQAALKVNTDGVLLGAWVKLKNSDKVLEVGTGSGVIALMLNQRFKETSITSIDIDQKSYEEASFNVRLNEASSIEVVHKSFQEYAKLGISFDHIVSNPPYFQNSTKSIKSNLNVAKHTDNLTFRDFWKSVAKVSHNKTSVSVVLPYEESKFFVDLAHEFNFGINRQLNVRPKKISEIKRVLIEFKRFEYCKNERAEMFMHHPGQHNYSEDYIELTKDFYLAF